VETANVTIGGYVPASVAVNPTTGRVYAATNTSLIVIEGSSGMILANITLPAGDEFAGNQDNIAIDSASNVIYVSVQGEIAEINGSTNSLLGEIDVPLQTLAYDPITNVLWGTVSYSSDGPAIIGVDARTGQMTADLRLGFSNPSPGVGYYLTNVAVDPDTNMVYAIGCRAVGLSCNALLSIANGTGQYVAAKVYLNASAPTMAINSMTDVVYVAAEGELMAVNGTNGHVIFDVSPQQCGPFPGTIVVPSSNQVILVPQNTDYVMIYDGASGQLVSMYSLSSSPRNVQYSPVSNDLYLTTLGHVLIFPYFDIGSGAFAGVTSSALQCPPI